MLLLLWTITTCHAWTCVVRDDERRRIVDVNINNDDGGGTIELDLPLMKRARMEGAKVWRFVDLFGKRIAAALLPHYAQRNTVLYLVAVPSATH